MKLYSNGPGQMTKMAAMPIYGNILKNLLQVHWANSLETRYVASGTLVLQFYLNNDPRLTLTYFMAKSNLVL